METVAEVADVADVAVKRQRTEVAEVAEVADVAVKRQRTQARTRTRTRTQERQLECNLKEQPRRFNYGDWVICSPGYIFRLMTVTSTSMNPTRKVVIMELNEDGDGVQECGVLIAALNTKAKL